MATVTFVVGLCGSGKSWFADRIVARKFDEGFLHDGTQHDALIAELSRGNDCVVVEIEYCREYYRREIVGEVTRALPAVNINWLCIENDLCTANKNCRKRTNKGDPESHIRINQDLSRSYSYPAGGVILRMWTQQP